MGRIFEIRSNLYGACRAGQLPSEMSGIVGNASEAPQQRLMDAPKRLVYLSSTLKETPSLLFVFLSPTIIHDAAAAAMHHHPPSAVVACFRRHLSFLTRPVDPWIRQPKFVI